MLWCEQPKTGNEHSCSPLEMGSIAITGKVRTRFIQAAVLLYMLDPVRGESTIHGLDQDPHEIETPRERLLKRKFLDSFALLCAVRKDCDSVSAACMEEGAPQGTIIRVASNAGVGQSTLSQLRQILGFLNSAAGAGKSPPSYVNRQTGLMVASFRPIWRRSRALTADHQTRHYKDSALS